MQEVVQSTFGQLVIGGTGLLILTVIGVYIALKFRDENDSIESNDELMMKFREMRQEGHINDEEFRHIRTDLEGKLSQQSSAESVDSDSFDLQG